MVKVFKDFDIFEDFEGIYKYLDVVSGKEGEILDINVEVFIRILLLDEVIVDVWFWWMKVFNFL